MKLPPSYHLYNWAHVNHHPRVKWVANRLIDFYVWRLNR